MDGTPGYSSWVIEHLRIGNTFRLKIGRNSVGRIAKNQVQINSTHVSKYHAFINVSTDSTKLEVLDNDSENGTFVNNIRLDTISQRVFDGDIIGFGVNIENDPSLPLYVVKLKPLPSSSSVAANLKRLKIKHEEPATSRDGGVQTAVTSSSNGETLSKATIEDSKTIIIIDSDDDDDEMVTSTIRPENLISNKNNNITSSDNRLCTTTESNYQDKVIKDPVFDLAIVKREELTDKELENVPPAEAAETFVSTEFQSQLQTSLYEIAEKEKKNIQEEAGIADIPNEDNDCEEIMYSQALASDIKADFDELPYVNQENGDRLNETSGDIQISPTWSIASDDEAADKDCKDKVSGWSSRVFDYILQIYHTQVENADFLSEEDEKRQSAQSISSADADFQFGEMNEPDVPIENDIMDSEKASSVESGKDLDLPPLKRTAHCKATHLMSTDESGSDDEVVNQKPLPKLFSHKIKECRVKLRRVTVDNDLLSKIEPKKSTSPLSKSELYERLVKSKPVSRGPIIIDAAPMYRRRSKNGTMVSLKRSHAPTEPNANETEKSNLECKGKGKGQGVELPKRGPKIKRIRLEDKKASNTKTLKEKSLQKQRISKSEFENIEEKRKEELSDIVDKGQNQIESKVSKHQDSSSSQNYEITDAVKHIETSRGAFLAEDTDRNSNKNHHEKLEEELEENKKKEKIRKEAERIRAIQKPEKVSFARMESDLKETNMIEAKFKRSQNIMAEKCKNVEVGLKANNNKEVFPQTFLLQKTTHDQRHEQWLKNYPKIDRTNDIISMILKYSNDWLPHRNVEFNVAVEPLVQKPKKGFLNYTEYQKTFFSLMRLEYLNQLERDMKNVKDSRPVPITVETTTITKHRRIIIAKCGGRDVNPLYKYDLVLLTFKGLKLETKETFAYLSSVRRFGQEDTLELEVLQEYITQEEIQNATDVSLLSVTDNLQVTFGALNAIYQLEAAPLRESIINPEVLVDTKMELPSTSAIPSKTYHPVNNYQKAAIMQTYLRAIQDESRTISLIKGPPGTGKSLVITNLTLQLLYGHEVRKLDNKILICAQSNKAVDAIADSLQGVIQRITNVDDRLKYRVLRYGVYDRIAPHVRHISTQSLIEKELFKRLQRNDKAFENVKNMETHLCNIETEIQRISMNPLHDENEDSKLKEFKRQREKVLEIKNHDANSHEYHDLQKWFLANANIVCVTLSSCIRLAQYIDYFDVCIIDEATQCTEPWTLMPLRFGISSLILVGDSMQLPVTVISKEAYDAGLGESMFTRIENCIESKEIMEKYPDEKVIFSLHTQYRMHPEICRWPNSYFYKGLLKNADTTLQLDTQVLPYAVLHLDFSKSVSRGQGKMQNFDEANFVAGLVKALGQYLPFETNSYGVITPYNYQRSVLSSTMKKLGLPDNILVSTIDAYQGTEKDVIIVSNTRTLRAGFLGNYQRLNVAITRPKKCLLICGNFHDLKTSTALHALLKDARERDLYFNVKADHVDDIESTVLKFLVKKPNSSARP